MQDLTPLHRDRMDRVHDLTADQSPQHASALRQLREAAAGLEIRPWGLPAGERAALRTSLRALPSAEQVRILKAAVDLMPSYRKPDDKVTGPLLYEAASLLYSTRLPLTEDDLCELLTSAHHLCGHGADVRPPFDLARDYMRRNGFSPKLAAAINAMVAQLPKSGAVKVGQLRRAADLLSVLTHTPQPVRGQRPWIDTVAEVLADLDADELRVWQRLVIAMSVGERHVMPSTYATIATTVIDELGPTTVLDRLRVCWPDTDRTVSLKRSGAQLLKHFIWLLELLPNRVGEDLVCEVAEMTWDRQAPPMAVLKPAAAYLSDSTSSEAQAARSLLEQQIAVAMAR
jgi:hypothetical protein